MVEVKSKLDRRTFLQATTTALLGTPLVIAAEPSVGLKAIAVTAGPKHHFYGYYDKCPWDATGRYLLGMEIGFCDRQPKPGETLTVGMVDLKDGNRFIPLAETTLWSWQQGTMLQWMGSAADSEVIYNALVDGQPAAVIRNVHSGATRSLPMPIYAISGDGKHAVALDYARLHRLRPGYGYASLNERFANQPAPQELGVWHIDIATGNVTQIVTLAQLAAHQPDDRFKGAEHWVNHLQFNPSGTRVVFLHRWKKPGQNSFSTRMLTVKRDGSDLRILHDSGQISHFDWRDNETMLAWVRMKKGEPKLAFALLHVDGRPAEMVFESVAQDGHCSYSPNRKWVLNDTYPDKNRMQHLMLLNVATQRAHSVNKFHSPPAFAGPTRCDLHPRWNRDGTQVCFDGCHEAQRQIYVVDVREIVGT
jgi:hypothetical protein